MALLWSSCNAVGLINKYSKNSDRKTFLYEKSICNIGTFDLCIHSGVAGFQKTLVRNRYRWKQFPDCEVLFGLYEQYRWI